VSSLGAVRLIQSQLYKVEPNDPVSLIAASLVLVAMALLAAYLPASQATRIDPMAAMRCE